MKKFITTCSILISVFFNIMADDVILPLIPDKPIDNKDKGKGHRIPPRSINSTISTETGVSIPGVETSEIISFEIYDESGELCFASFNDEMEFVSFLFSLEGDYVIRFITEDKSYSGFISL